MNLPANYQDTPTIEHGKHWWIVTGDPQGPGAHHWCNRRICKFYKTERAARRKHEELLRAQARRNGGAA